MGPEYIDQKLYDLANKIPDTLIHMQPGKPTQSEYVERFNRTAKHEWLDLHNFESVKQFTLNN